MTALRVEQIPDAEVIGYGFDQAVVLHNAGRLQEAEALYEAILKAQPNHPEANHNCGVLCVRAGLFEASIPYFCKAVEANPTAPQFWLSYVEAHVLAGRRDDARLILEHAKAQGLTGASVEALEKSFVV
jgi:tetratricopeptide (TPR) repeat protein